MSPSFPLAHHTAPHEASVQKGKSSRKLRKNYFFRGTFVIMPSTKGFGFKDRNFGGIFPEEGVPKNNIWLRWPELPHNRRYTRISRRQDLLSAATDAAAFRMTIRRF
jgi:hypothetical protein